MARLLRVVGFAVEVLGWFWVLGDDGESGEDQVLRRWERMVIDERKTPWKKGLDRQAIDTGSVGISGLNRVTEEAKAYRQQRGRFGASGSLPLLMDYY